MALFSEEFAGWRDSDFDAFAPAKWRSNRYTPERTGVRLRLAAALERAAAAAGLASDGLALWASRQDPAFTNQHEVRTLTVAWARAGAENIETAHIYAGIAVDAASVTLRIRLPGAQETSWGAHRATLAELAMLAGMRLVEGTEDLAPEAILEGTRVGDVLLERRMARAEAIDGLLTVDELAAWSGVVIPLLTQLLGVPLMQFAPIEQAAIQPAAAVVEETPETAVDSVSTATTVPAVGLRDPSPRRGYRPQWAPQTATRAGAAEGVRPPIERISPPTWHPEPPRRPEPPRYPEPRRASPPAGRRQENGPPSQRAPASGASFAPGRPFELPATPQKASSAPGVLAAGARVELQKGLFAGKTGTVAEVAGAHVQVLLGLMSVRVATGDLRVL